MKSGCSEEFYEAFSAGWGSYYADCACGRHYMATQEHNLGEEEDYLQFEQKMKEQPDKYIDLGHCSISFINVGQEYVDGCDCGNVERYENWIWTNRDRIMKYIKLRSSREVARAKQELEKLIEHSEM